MKQMRGKCGKNAVFKLSDNGVLTISGSGDLYNYELDFLLELEDLEEDKMVKGLIQKAQADANEERRTGRKKCPVHRTDLPKWTRERIPWYDRRNDIYCVIIKTGIRSIGSYMFLDCLELSSVYIPESVERIGEYAFENCEDIVLFLPENSPHIEYAKKRNLNYLAGSLDDLKDAAAQPGSGVQNHRNSAVQTGSAGHGRRKTQRRTTSIASSMEVEDLNRQNRLFANEFSSLLKQYPDVVLDEKKLRGILKDCFPEKSLQVYLTGLLYKMGISDAIESTTQIDDLFGIHFRKHLIFDYGIDAELARWGVSLWCVCYAKQLKIPCSMELYNIMDGE